MLMMSARIGKEVSLLMLSAVLLFLFLRSGLVMAGLPPIDRPVVYGFQHMDHASALGLKYGFYKALARK